MVNCVHCGKEGKPQIKIGQDVFCLKCALMLGKITLSSDDGS